LGIFNFELSFNENPPFNFSRLDAASLARAALFFISVTSTVLSYIKDYLNYLTTFSSILSNH